MRLPPGGRERNFQGLRAPEPLYGAYPAPNPGVLFARAKSTPLGLRAAAMRRLAS